MAGAPNSTTWVCKRALRHGHGGSSLQVVKFSADGRYCMTGGHDKSIVLWNPYREEDGAGSAGQAPPVRASDPTPQAPSGLLVQRYSGQHGSEIVDLAISRDGGRFASAGGGDKCAIVWDITSGNVIRKIFGHDGRLASCAWNDYLGGEANILVTGGQDKIVRAWDLRAPGREPVQALKDAKDSITRVMVEGPPRVEEAARTAAAVSSAGGAGARGGAGHQAFLDKAPLSSASAVPSGPPSSVRIVASSMDGSIRTYDVRKPSVTTDTVGPPVATCSLAHSGAGVLASTFSPGRGGALLLMDRQSGTVLNRYTGHSNSAYRLGCCMTSDDALVATGSEDGRLCIWDTLALPDAAPLGPAAQGGIPAHSRAVSWVEPHPKAGTRALLTAGFDGVAKLWEPADTGS